ncbi:hypothetical protein MYXO_01979 [Myxococcaceae bacterium]|nr:hypothetical protein MYXO_01979 [Myxococcaceae bacterium]
MSHAMTKPEREAFLAELHVGVLSIPDAGRGPLSVPIWYAYEPGGEIRIVTDRASRKGRLLEPGVRVSLVAQSEAIPYRYVSVEGPVVSAARADLERDVRPMAHRYLGRELGDQYVAATSGDRTDGESVVVAIRPERWLTVDYGKEFATR